MAFSQDTIVLVQHFPGTDDYVVHRDGATVEFYHTQGNIKDERVIRFIKECIAEKMYHEHTVRLASGLVSGAKTLPVKQVIYCRDFEAEAPEGSKRSVNDINWVLWSPTTFELTISRGRLGVARTSQLQWLADASSDVLEFMHNCVGSGVALARHYSKPFSNGKMTRMQQVSEYFFSAGKVIFGFQRDDVVEITPEELSGIGLE